jgi:hypothetical protein
MLINSPNISGSLTVTGNAIITGSLTVAGGINAAITGSATSASYVEYSNVANKPTLVSGSSQITYSGLSSIPSGIVSSSAQVGEYNIFATTGSNTFQANQIVTGSLFITQNLVVAGSSSIQYISSSVVDIADNIITVNAFNPGVRFGGLAVADSGSSPRVSGSILFDSIKDQWIFVHESSATTSSVLLMGPETYNDLGNETYLSANRLPKGSGIEHLRDSNITDTGTVVSVNSNTAVTGSFTVVTGSAVELQVTNTGVNIGSIPTDNHNVTGSLRVSGSMAVTGSLAVNGTGSFLTNSNGFVARFTGGATGGVLGGFFANSTTGFASIGVQSNHEFRIFTNDTDRLTISASTGAATFSSTVTATGNVRSINTGVDGTFADAFVGVYNVNNNEQNAIQTSVSSAANVSGFRFQASNGGGSAGRTTVVDFLRDRQIFYGNVGIGTSSPNRKLELITSGGSTLGIAASDNGAGILYGRLAFYTNSNSNEFINYGGEIRSYSGAGIDQSDLRFYTAGVSTSTERMRITAGGNIGINTNSPTTYSLAGRHMELFGGGDYSFFHNNTTTVKSFYAINEASLLAALFTFSNHPLTLGTNNTERMRITSGGNVGIGITTPFSRLHVTNSDTLEGTIAIGNSLYPGLIYSSATTGEFRIDNRSSSSSGFITFYPNGQNTTLGSEAMRITTGGNVLIGETNPPVFSTPNGGKLLMLPNAVIVSGLIALGSPYTQNIQIDIVYNNWGGNNVLGLVDMIITLREYANTSGTAFGKIFATNSGSGATFSSFNTTNITTSQCSVTATSGGNYTLRITIDPSNVTDRGSFYLTIPNAGGTGSTISSITVSYV